MFPRSIYSALFLILTILIGMFVNVSSRPASLSSRSSEDILAGVDFLSLFINSAKEQSRSELTTLLPDDINSPTILPTINEDTNTELIITSTQKVVFIKNTPSAIVSESRRNDFSIEESDPTTMDSKSEAKVKRKSEDLLAIGANPDYIAQQQARTHKENLPNFNLPYYNRNPTRSRSVSYGTVIQSLPSLHQQIHPSNPWKQEVDANQPRTNSPVIVKPIKNNNNEDYENHNAETDYDYTENYPDFNSNSSSLLNNHYIESTAESKDYFVTRKYSPVEFNESADKNRQGQHNLASKKTYEPTERNWGVPEKNYETMEHHQNLPTVYGKSEQNYEIDEAVSVMTNGRAHGVQGKSTENPLNDNQKVGYVVEGRNYKKYRVEERTSDGFIVGEYGVVSNNDGSLRGVRYTADSTINPRVIYDALMKFLSL